MFFTKTVLISLGSSVCRWLLIGHDRFFTLYETAVMPLLTVAHHSCVYLTLCCVFIFQISAACRVSSTRRPARASTWRCREWTGTSVKSSPTSSPPWGPRSSIGTETHWGEPSCCSAHTERTHSSSRSVQLCFFWRVYCKKSPKNATKWADECDQCVCVLCLMCLKEDKWLPVTTRPLWGLSNFIFNRV